MIQNVAESFSNGAGGCAESRRSTVSISNYRNAGHPPNLDDLTAAIEEIKPAHLAYDYIIIYRTWGDVKGYTWGQLKSHTWADVRGGTIL
jgi:hypothetical protein